MAQIGRFDTDAAALVRRIAAHDRYGKNDLNAWCFDQMGLADGMSVLDLGCGTGKQSIDLALHGCTVTAVDASPEALATLSATASAKRLGTISTVLSDFDHVSDRIHGEFDRCVSAYAIYYARQPEALFRFIHSALRPGGALFFCGPAYDNNMEMREFLTAIGRSFTPGAAPFMEDTGPALARVIFPEVEISSFENPLTFDSPDAIWSYWSSHNMFDAALEDRFRKKAEAHFRENDIFQMVKRVRGVLAVKPA